MRFRLFHVLLMGDGVRASKGVGWGGVMLKKKIIQICLLLWKNMHIHLAFRFSKGRTEEMGTCQVPYSVASRACVNAQMFMGDASPLPPPPPLSFFKWSSLFSSPSLHLCCYHSNTNDCPHSRKVMCAIRLCLISTWQSVAAADGALASPAEG